MPARASSSSSGHCSKLRGPSQNSPCVASKRDVNITKLNYPLEHGIRIAFSNYLALHLVHKKLQLLHVIELIFDGFSESEITGAFSGT
ncbi:hypothetical protein AVEN_11320-1 [Araneus ventricosus]|uniref:Uncharacterized protein n=1 Tax=Araneus ventricosus TaxID=182803 RepID=A0A4Y2MVE1_ARAVE|nr:hypothetical protein AVEN_168086-1 [Araneus ventricosus]GBN30558.1 hypothetical protein AVEN_11320-1 [Araneus ventricosus]